MFRAKKKPLSAALVIVNAEGPKPPDDQRFYETGTLSRF
jgi:hypothetical protein